MTQDVQSKFCSHCKTVYPLTDFHRHPTASFGRKHICKSCSKIQDRKNQLERLAAAGKSPRIVAGGTVAVSTSKKGDVREDGLVFWSKRKNKHGFQEWWMTPEKFEQRLRRAAELRRKRIATDPSYIEKERARSRTEGAKAAKRRWNKKSRARLSSWHANRRAMARGTTTNLSDKEKAEIRDIYRFRDVLNAVHQKPVFHVDHKVPISKGGKHEPLNLQVATREFNVKKGAKLLYKI